jgi:hypothetical protein
MYQLVEASRFVGACVGAPTALFCFVGEIQGTLHAKTRSFSKRQKTSESGAFENFFRKTTISKFLPSTSLFCTKRHQQPIRHPLYCFIVLTHSVAV